jgi:hypothetical protein
VRGEEAALTTLALGEEVPNTRANTGGLTSLEIGEETATTPPIGEEDPAALASERNAEFTTLALGEEGKPTTKNATTLKIGEETLTTLVVGEEGSPPQGLELKNPFGAF